MFESQSLWVVSIVGLFALGVLVASADLAVNRLIKLAAYFHLSTTFMGVTVVSLATSIPEITAHIVASLGIVSNRMDYRIGSSIVLGANIGSDVIQQTLIMGLVVFIAGALRFRRYFLWKSMIPMIGTTVMCIVLGLDRTYSRLDGAILFGVFLGYMVYLYRDERKFYRPEDNGFGQNGEAPDGVPTTGRQATVFGLTAAGALAVAVGSAAVVLNLTELVVQRTAIGGSLIGVLTLGVASALPEFITAISGVRHREHGISLGTLVGSNITNPLVAIGGGALISTYWVPRPLLVWDLPWETVTGIILWVILWVTRGKLGKLGAFYLIGLYFAYVVLRAVFFAVD
ncbi:MAG: sodium:calcium antiporter [Anaerolineales bacterium]|nr:sodium:calcium antiporter [Anaerolineales bacterium]